MLWFLITVTPTPTPTPASGVDPNLVTPGVWGFSIFAFVAIASVFLAIDMTRRLRRVRYRALIRERLDAEAAGVATPNDPE